MISQYLPWLLSAITIWSSFLAGNKDIKAWKVALCNQFLWSVWVIVSQTWGFVPLNIALWIVYYRNYRKWKNEAA